MSSLSATLHNTMTPSSANAGPIEAALGALAGAVFFFSSLVDLPGRLFIASASCLAILSVGYFCSAVGLLIALTASGLLALRTVLPLLIFLFWAMTSLLWTPTVGDGIQNVLVLTTFAALIIAAATCVGRYPAFATLLEKHLGRSAFWAALTYATALTLYGPGTSNWLGARGFGLFALFGVAHHLAKWRSGKRSGLFWSIAFTALIAASLSRLALGIAVLLFPLSQFSGRSWTRRAKAFSTLIAVLAVSYLAVGRFAALRERFFSGDASWQIGPFRIDPSGRQAFWRATYDSFLDDPVFGKGAGSTQGLIESVFLEIRHPHSDYLRIAHDYGIVGLSIWSVAILILLRSLWKAWRAAEHLGSPTAPLQQSGFLLLVAFVLQMTMENSMVYIFVAAPLGLVIGTSLGLRHQR